MPPQHPSQDTPAIQAFQSALTKLSQAASGSSGFLTSSGLQVQRLASAFGQTHTAELLSIQPRFSRHPFQHGCAELGEG